MSNQPNKLFAPEDGRGRARPTPPALRVVGAERRPWLAWSWFCGYCAASPRLGERPEPFTRVCERCGLGILLEAPADATPSRGETFVVLDDELVVRALSKHGERTFLVSEPDAVGQPLAALLPHGALTQRLELSVKRAAIGDETLRHAVVRVGPDAGDRVSVRMACCGPPAAALVVFEPDTGSSSS